MGNWPVCINQLIYLTWLDSSHIHVNVLGHTPTPFLSVESCHFRLFPGKSHSFQIFLDYTSPVCPWPTGSPLETWDLPINQSVAQPINHRSIYTDQFTITTKTHVQTLHTLYLRSCFEDPGMWSIVCCDPQNSGHLHCWIASPSLRATHLPQPHFCIRRILLTYRVLLKNNNVWETT